jgi:HEAT repeat protein
LNTSSDIKCLLESNDEEVRHEALQRLEVAPLSETCNLLYIGMGDESWRVRKEAVDIFVSAAPEPPEIESLLELMRDQDNAGLRNSAAEAVIRLGMLAASPLKRLADDSDADLRKLVIDIMGQIASPEFTPFLLAALRDPDINVASAAAENLGNIGDDAIAPELIRAVIENNSVLFRFSAMLALGKLSTNLGIPGEIIKLADESILRNVVYDCVGNIGDETAAAMLLQGFVLRQKSSRIAAVNAWYRIYSRSHGTSRVLLEDSFALFCSTEILENLIDLFDIQNPILSEALIVLLGITGNMRSADMLFKAFNSERLSDFALSSLVRIASKNPEELLTLYPYVSAVSKSAICTAMGVIGFQRATSVIREALYDTSSAVRKSAVAAAGKLGMIDSINDIASLLDYNDSEVRKSVIDCLLDLVPVDRIAIQDVAKRLGDSGNPEQRKNAVLLYTALGEGELLPHFLKDVSPSVRRSAVSSLGKLNIITARGPLQLALVDEDPDVRIAAIESLSDLFGIDVLPQLMHALNDDDPWVQCTLLKTIAKYDNSKLLTAINTLFSDAKGILMSACLELLDSIGTSDAMVMVESALKDSDREVVSQALVILARRRKKGIA